jgi:CheY-like chemotaxis protein
MPVPVSECSSSSSTGIGAAPIRPNVLVVDDDELIRNLVFRAGARYGWEVRLAENGLEAARLLKDTHWDVLLTDIFMPGMDGLELIRMAARLSVPPVIVAMTGGGNFDFDYPHMAELVGARLVLRKPFALQQILDAVQMATLRRV